MRSSAGPRELGTIAVTAAVMLRLASFMITAEWARAEKPRPPYSGGMIMPKKRSVFEELPDRGGEILVVLDDLPVIEHGAELLDRAIEKSLFRRGQGRGGEVEEFSPLRTATEEFAVPADAPGLQGLAFGGGEGREHALEEGKEGGGQDGAAQGDNAEEGGQKGGNRDHGQGAIPASRGKGIQAEGDKDQGGRPHPQPGAKIGQSSADNENQEDGHGSLSFISYS